MEDFCHLFNLLIEGRAQLDETIRLEDAGAAMTLCWFMAPGTTGSKHTVMTTCNLLLILLSLSLSLSLSLPLSFSLYLSLFVCVCVCVCVCKYVLVCSFFSLYL